MAAVLAVPALRHIIAGGTLALFAMGSIGQFLPPFFVRSHGLDFGLAALLVGPIQFGAALTGLLIGGYGADRLARRDPRWRVWLPGCGILLGAAAYFTGFSMSAILPAAIGIGLGGIGLLSYLPPTLSLVQNLVPPGQRGVAIAVYTLISGIIGTGIGPGLVGWISDAFAERAFSAGDFASLCPGGHAVAGSGLDAACRAAAADGLNSALLFCCAILVWAASHYFIAARHLKPVPGA
jgi:MFS family permease